MCLCAYYLPQDRGCVTGAGRIPAQGACTLQSCSTTAQLGAEANALFWSMGIFSHLDLTV